MGTEYRPGRMNDRTGPDEVAYHRGYITGVYDGLTHATALVKIASALLRPRLTDDGVAALDELLRLLAADIERAADDERRTS